jgi:hypothetical protein
MRILWEDGGMLLDDLNIIRNLEATWRFSRSLTMKFLPILVMGNSS